MDKNTAHRISPMGGHGSSDPTPFHFSRQSISICCVFETDGSAHYCHIIAVQPLQSPQDQKEFSLIQGEQKVNFHSILLKNMKIWV